MIRAFATRPKSSTRCSKSRRRRALPGIATTTMAMASMRMARRLTERGSAADGRCSPASGRTTSWRPVASRRPKRLLTTLESFANEGGLISGASLGLARHTGARTAFWPAFRIGHAARVGARRVSQAATLAARRAALRPAAANRAALSDRQRPSPRAWCGGSTTRFARCRPAKSCASRRWRPAVIHWSCG